MAVKLWKEWMKKSKDKKEDKRSISLKNTDENESDGSDNENKSSDSQQQQQISNELKLFLKTHGFGQCVKIIIDNIDDYGIITLDDLFLLSKRDLNDLASDLGLKFAIKKKFVTTIHKQKKLNKKSKKKNNASRQIDASKYIWKSGTQMVPHKPYKPATGKPSRTILVIGETGTGKTTLLNSMMNYLYNIQYDDGYRLKIIEENNVDKDGKKKSQAHSQTSTVTQYYIEPPMLSYGLVLIDTPGFGDTKGMHQDKKIFEDIAKFFEKVIEIDGICFVMRAPQGRCTPKQKYIFDRVLSIFGKDIKDNIFVLATFADAKNPPCLTALKEAKIPYRKHFKLNNSAFFLQNNYNINDYDKKFNEMFWDMGINSFKSFFENLDKVQTKSLKQTKTVLDRRKGLEISINSINPVIKNGLSVLDQIRDTLQIVKNNKGILNDLADDKAKGFKVVTKVPRTKKVVLTVGIHTTTCLVCNRTCHEGCGIPNDSDKKGCLAMDANGFCRTCPEKCEWNKHSNLPYLFEHYVEKKETKLTDIANKYFDAESNVSRADQTINGLQKELQQETDTLLRLIIKVKGFLDELDEIALHPNPRTTEGYFDVLIEAENSEREVGWKTRVNALKNLKQTNKLIIDIKSSKFDPFQSYKDVTNEIGGATSLTCLPDFNSVILDKPINKKKKINQEKRSNKKKKTNQKKSQHQETWINKLILWYKKHK